MTSCQEESSTSSEASEKPEPALEEDSAIAVTDTLEPNTETVELPEPTVEEIPRTMYLVEYDDNEVPVIYHYCYAEDMMVNVELEQGEIWRALGQDSETYKISSSHALRNDDELPVYTFAVIDDFGKTRTLQAVHNPENGRVDWIGFFEDGSVYHALDVGFRDSATEVTEECDEEEGY